MKWSNVPPLPLGRAPARMKKMILAKAMRLESFYSQCERMICSKISPNYV